MNTLSKPVSWQHKALSCIVALALAVGMIPTSAYAQTNQMGGAGLAAGTMSGPAGKTGNAGDHALLCSERDGEVTIAGVVDADVGRLAAQADDATFVYRPGLDADQNLTIPPTIEGKTVTAIGEGAFEDQNWIASVTVPGSVKIIGARAFRGCAGLRSASLAQGIELIDSEAFAGTGLTSIAVPATAALASAVFQNCDSLASATLAEGVRFSTEYWREKNGDDYDGDDENGDGSTFYDCDALTSVSLPRSLKRVANEMFYSCDALGSVFMAEGVTAIGSEAFEGCERLASFNLPSTLTSVGYEAFRWCRPSAAVTLPAALTAIGEGAFIWSAAGYYTDDDVWVPTSSFSIAASTWAQYYKLNGNARYLDTATTTVTQPSYADTSSFELEFTESPDGSSYAVTGVRSGTSPTLVIPASHDGKPVTSIGDRAFEDANWISSLEVPPSVKTIGDSAFIGAYSMKRAVLSSGLELIGSDAFSKTGLTSIAIPSTAALSYRSFSDCDALVSATLPEGVRFAAAYWRDRSTSGGDGEDDDGGSYRNDGLVFYDCDALASVSIPRSLGTVSHEMFQSCDKLASVSIAEGITAIDDEGFGSCASLSSFNLPSTLTAVGKRAFFDVHPGAPVVLPSALAEIGEHAFEWWGTNGYYDAAGNWVDVPEHTIACATWRQYWKLLANPRYIDTASTTVLMPQGAASPAFSLTFSANSSGGMSVTGYAAGATPSPVLQIPATYNGAAVTEIAAGAFEDANWLQSVTIPSSVKAIGDGAFIGTYSLTSASLANGIELIGSRAFEQTGLISVAIPATAALSYRSFAQCERLEHATLAEGAVPAAAYWRERGTATVDYDYDEDSDEEIFMHCTSLKSANVPKSFQKVPSEMFDSCWSLEAVTIAEGIDEVGSDAFEYCSRLRSFNLPSTLVKVGSWSFYDCVPAAPVALPASLSEIGRHAFKWTESYYGDDWEYPYPEQRFTIETSTWSQYYTLNGNDAYIDPGTTDVLAPIGIGQEELELTWRANLDANGNEDGTVTITGVRSRTVRLAIPSEVPTANSSDVAAQGAGAVRAQAGAYKVTGIGTGAFKDNSYMQSIVLPASVKTIGAEAFANCASLREVQLPEPEAGAPAGSGQLVIADNAFSDSDSVVFVCDEDLPIAVASVDDSGVMADRASATATTIGEFAGVRSLTTQSEVPLTLATVEVVGSKVVSWYGTPVQPDVRVMNGETELVRDRDFTVAYPANHVGNNYVTVQAKEGSRYTGSNSTGGFKLVGNLAAASIAPVGPVAYAGEPARPKPAVTLYGTPLREGADFVYSWSGNDAVGLATVTITPASSGTCTGSNAATFSIVAAASGAQDTSPDRPSTAEPGSDISSATVTLSKTSYTYNRSACKPQVTVRLGGAVLSADFYSVSYSSNTNAGTAFVTVTGKNGYKGSASAAFTISKASNTLKAKGRTVKLTSNLLKGGRNTVLGPKVSKPKGKVTYKKSSVNKRKGKFKVDKSNGKITIAKNTPKGTYKVKVKVTAAGTKNYKSKSSTATVKVKVV